MLQKSFGCALGFLLLAAAPASATPEEIRQAEAEWTAATKDKDFATLERLLAPEFELTGGEAKKSARDRSGWLKFLPNMTFHSYNTDVTDVRINGTIALAKVSGEWEVEVMGQKHKEPFKLYDVWVRREGRWQVVRRYVID